MNALSLLLLPLSLSHLYYYKLSNNGCASYLRRCSYLKWCSVVFSLIFTTACVDSSNISSKNLSSKGDLATFTLDNGLDVILWENNESDTAFKLIIKSGSLQEEDQQLGYAHFVEHMAFNQTTPNGTNPIHEQLEKLDLSLGKHANAFTYFSHTDYHLYIEDNEAEKTQIALDLLSHFAINSHFDEREVEKEKPIIIEEWRLIDTEHKSVASQIFHSSIQDSRYAERFPIGSYESINSATAESLKQYYERHYRADNATLVVTGNMDPKAIKESIEAAFGMWKPSNDDSNNTYPLPAADNKSVEIYSDENIGKYVLTRSHTFNTSPYLSNEDEIKTNQLVAILDTFNDRFKHRLLDTQGNVEGIKARFKQDNLGRVTLSFTAVTNYDGISQAVIILTEEIARMTKYGLLEKEWQQWREERESEITENFDDPLYLSFIASNHVLYDELMLDQKDYLRLIKTSHSEASLSDIKQTAVEYLNLPFQTTLAHKTGQPIPTHETLLNYFKHNTDHIVPNVSVLDDQEWPLSKEAGHIVSKKTLSSGVVEYQLSNDMVVRFYDSSSSEDNVFMHLVGLGGLNEMPEKEALAARLAISVMGASGLRDMTGPELEEWFSKADVGLKAHFTFNARELEMNSSIESVDKILRLMHIAVTEVNVDPKMFTYIQKLNLDQLEQMALSPTNDFSLQAEAIMTNNDPALRRMTQEEVLQIDANSMSDIYQDYFQGSQNYVLTIVGGVSIDYLETLLVDYVANIPKTEAKRSTPRPSPIASESIVVEGKGSGNKATRVTIIKTVPKTTFGDGFHPDTAWIKERINKALFEQIREEKGLVYSISAAVDGDLSVAESYVLRIDFSADPDKSQYVIDSVNQVIQEVALDKPSKSELEKFLKKSREMYQSELLDGKRLASLLAGVDFYNVSIDTLFSVEDFIPEKSPASTQELMSAFLSDESIDTTFILNP